MYIGCRSIILILQDYCTSTFTTRGEAPVDRTQCTVKLLVTALCCCCFFFNRSTQAVDRLGGQVSICSLYICIFNRKFAGSCSVIQRKNYGDYHQLYLVTLRWNIDQYYIELCLMIIFVSVVSIMSIWMIISYCVEVGGIQFQSIMDNARKKETKPKAIAP